MISLFISLTITMMRMIRIARPIKIPNPESAPAPGRAPPRPCLSPDRPEDSHNTRHHQRQGEKPARLSDRIHRPTSFENLAHVPASIFRIVAKILLQDKMKVFLITQERPRRWGELWGLESPLRHQSKAAGAQRSCEPFLFRLVLCGDSNGRETPSE